MKELRFGKKLMLKLFPFPKSLLDEILELKNKNIHANIEKQEHEIDRLIYQLYDLNPKETSIIEKLNPLPKAEFAKS